jgi:hypothetical protein
VTSGLGISGDILQLGKHRQPVSIHSVPAGFGDPDAKKFVEYVFDDESEGRRRKSRGDWQLFIDRPDPYKIPTTCRMLKGATIC